MFKFPPSNKAHYLGETIEYVVDGNGPATVVLVNGSGGPIEGWHKVFGELAGIARVFAYNRPGVGGSSRPAVPQTVSHMSASLLAVLAEAGCPPPYVLVGHSFGGLVANMYARQYPREVAAVVMLEASTVDDIATQGAYETSGQRLLGKLLTHLFPPNPHAESEQAKVTAQELTTAPPFPEVPVLVVIGGKPAMTWATKPEAVAARARHQRQLCGLSPKARVIVAQDSGHFPQFSEPGVVVAVVKEALAHAASASTGISLASAKRLS